MVRTRGLEVILNKSYKSLNIGLLAIYTNKKNKTFSAETCLAAKNEPPKIGQCYTKVLQKV